MNNNRGNNRRRGRGNNRQQGGGHQQNRIDSRARGNAPQLLDKYKKLAHDAHLNGDRVQEEYYLQFADHYFRVLSDQKQRQDEQRQKRNDERQQNNDDDDDSDDDPRNDAADTASDDDDAQDSRRGKGRSRKQYEPEENPFVREKRSEKGDAAKPKRQPRRKKDDEAQARDDGVDPDILPPAISAKGDDDGEPAKKPARRTRKPKPSADEGGEELEAVG